MRNMRSATAEAGQAVDAALVGVLGWLDREGRPRACAVTPYRIDDDVVVTSTLALLGKVRALRRDPRAVVLAGGFEVAGRASLELDVTPASFDRWIREQELAKYPPARSLLSLPAHRRLLWWYVGRALVRLPLANATATPGPDRVTLTFVGGEGPRIIPLPVPFDIEGASSGSTTEVPPGVPDGPACVLVHEELEDFAALLQMRLVGDVRAGAFTVTSRTGSLAPAVPGPIAQLRELRRLAKAARRARPTFARLATELNGASDG